jgi:hypothetical protein
MSEDINPKAGSDRICTCTGINTGTCGARGILCIPIGPPLEGFVPGEEERISRRGFWVIHAPDIMEKRARGVVSGPEYIGIEVSHAGDAFK